jgi:hypothetical protein
MRRLSFWGYGDWAGYIAAAIVAMIIAGLSHLFMHL